MIYALKEFEILKKRWKGKQIMLFLDFDGTLTPIVENPEKACLSREVKEILEDFSKIHKYQLIVISGRSLEDIQNRVGVKNIIYVGNHGFEIKGFGMEFEGVSSITYKELVGILKREIKQKLSKFPGMLIEDKGLTISVHYRQVDQEQEIAVENMLYHLTQPYITNEEIFINWGKKVFEIRPPLNWDKGKAVMWILEKISGFPIYIGDDTTDEDAFLILKDSGVTIHVGAQSSSYAQYYLNNTDEVVRFLGLLRGDRKYEEIN